MSQLQKIITNSKKKNSRELSIPHSSLLPNKSPMRTPPVNDYIVEWKSTHDTICKIDKKC